MVARTVRKSVVYKCVYLYVHTHRSLNSTIFLQKFHVAIKMNPTNKQIENCHKVFIRRKSYFKSILVKCKIKQYLQKVFKYMYKI